METSRNGEAKAVMLGDNDAVATILPPETTSPDLPPRGKERLFLWIAAVAVVAATAALALWRARTKDSSAALAQPRTAVAVRGTFTDVIRLAGSTEAAQSYPVVAPRLAGEPASPITIVRLQANGARVQAGQLLVEFDRQNEIKSYLANRATYLDLLHQIAEQKASASAALAQNETNLQTAKDQLSTAELEMQRLEIMPRIQQEITREQLAEAQDTLRELRQTLEWRRQAVEAGLRDLELQARQARANMLYSEHNERRMAITSPVAGVVVLQSIWMQGRVGQVEEGDQVYPGTPILQVVNPSAMLVRAAVNQMDVLRLRVGQPATVRLDAYPGLAFPATLTQLSPIGSAGQFSNAVRTFEALFSVRGHNPKLMPDLSAAVDVLIEKQKDALVVPRDAVFREASHAYVRLRWAGGFLRHPVVLGPENNTVAVIESGLRKGDVVARRSSP